MAHLRLYTGGYVDYPFWFEAGDVKPLGFDLVKDTQYKVRSIETKLLVSRVENKVCIS